MSGNILKFKKKDIILAAAVIAVATLCAVLTPLLSRKGEFAVITVSGQEYGRYDLNENRTITVTTDLGTNEVTIEDGKVYVSYADCPQEICARHRPVSSDGESIICVPHELVITIASNSDEGEVDAVTG
ncbi:MAG: NusG domain II-containing protein [Clostridiales bacterium]|nr:NusG domain II-containing protein [Clostridiales bacterium]